MVANMKKVNDAIILAGGSGTRMLPASSYTCKEVLPLIDTPILNHLIWEACKSQVENIHIVISPIKNNIIKNSRPLNGAFKNLNVRNDLPQNALIPLPEDVKVIFHEQKIPGGIGHALKIALTSINGPFLVLLGDNLLMDEHPSLIQTGIDRASNGCKKLVDFYEKNEIPCAGIIKVEDENLEKYGVVKFDNKKIIKIIEKPSIIDAPSNYVLCGRYLLDINVKELLEKYKLEKYGEMQSIAIFDHLINNSGFGAVKLDGFKMYDSGDPIAWLKSQIDHALRREDLQTDFTEWIKNRLTE